MVPPEPTFVPSTGLTDALRGGSEDLLGEPPEGWIRPGIDGETFLLKSDVSITPVWGTEQKPRWASGEPFLIFAPPGVGKSSLAQNLALGRLGVPGFKTVLGEPVAPSMGQVLYIAADRPAQVARSWRRMVTEEDGDLLRGYLRVWPGPIPFSVSKQPDAFLPWIESFEGIKLVVVDSLFNVAPSLTDEDGSARANNAFQQVVAAGIDLLVIHHDRKRQESERKKMSSDDMYGGRAISAGAGAICYLDGEPGSGTFEARWLKTPAGALAKKSCSIDFKSGKVWEDSDFYGKTR